MQHRTRFGYELIDPHILCASDGRFTLPGFERVRNDVVELVSYPSPDFLDIEVEEAFDSGMSFRATLAIW